MPSNDKNRVLGGFGDYRRTFASEDGRHFRCQHQELGPAMRRAELIRQAEAQRGTGQMDRRYVGSVPPSILIKWLEDHGYTMDQWARNEGGDPYNKRTDGSGVYDKFLRYFLSRDFSKLHTQHTTTRKETSQFVVPASIARQAVDLAGVLPDAAVKLR